jgi:filamentous hemagglutinin
MLDYADANWFAAGGSKAASILTSSNFTDVAIRTAGRAFISSGISTTIGGGSFADNFGSALLGEAGSVAMATGFNFVGDQTIKFPEGGVVKVVAHALMGGLLSEAMGGDFATGAAAAGLNEAAMNVLVKFAGGNDQMQVMLSQLTGVLAAAAVDENTQLGAAIAGSATTYNYLYHREVKEMLAEMDSKSTDEEKLAVRDKYEALDKQRELERDEFCKGATDTCRQISRDLADDDEKFSELINKLRSEGNGAEAYWVSSVQGGNLYSAGSMASVVKAQEGGFFAKLGAVVFEMGAGIFPGRAIGKGTTAKHVDDEKVVDVKGVAGGAGGTEKIVTISKDRYPESAQHIEDAIGAGKPDTLTIDRDNAATRRRDSLRGIETKPGLDRDEYPPAMFQEGGQGASVRHIPAGDNRGAGACIGAQCRELPNGTKVRIEVID